MIFMKVQSGMAAGPSDGEALRLNVKKRIAGYNQVYLIKLGKKYGVRLTEFA
jgi:hypothetical protein